MSPEQAAGKPADRRSDNWAYGVVLWEMLTGRQLFTGESVSHVLAAVLKTDPDWQALPGETPLSVRRLLRRCLERSPKKRLPDAAMARLEIDEADDLSEVAAATAATASAPQQPALWQRPEAALAIGLGIALVAGLGVWSLTRPAPAPILRTSIVVPQTQRRTGTDGRRVAVSPAGTHVVYVADAQLYLRALDELEAQPLSGTEGSIAATPFFSPGGQSIGFWSERDLALQKVALSGGAAVTLAEVATAPYGANWGEDDTITFGIRGQNMQGVLQVAGAGGAPDVLVSIEPPNIAAHPQILPGGKAVLYTLAPGGPTQWDTAQIVVERLATHERTVVIEGGSDARYLPTGHLVYALGGTLLAVTFDLDQLAVTGSPVTLVEGVSRSAFTGDANVDVSATGTLVYLADEGARDLSVLEWVHRDGTVEALAAPPRYYTIPSLSPDGTRVLLDADDRSDDLWIWDLSGNRLTRLTFDPGYDDYGVWTPDGQRVVFSSSRDASVQNLYWRMADGSGTVERLTESANRQMPTTVSPDGTHVIFQQNTVDTRSDLLILSLDGDRGAQPLIATTYNELNAEISPDGRWLAYESDASGQFEVWVQPFPDVDTGLWQISTTGGTQPAWASDGRKLFYMTEAGVIELTVGTGEVFEVGIAALVVSAENYETSVDNGSRTYDITPDGQRFLMLKQSASAGADDPFAGLTQIHVIQNWTQELLERVPMP